MDVTKIIKAKIGHSNYVVAEPIMKEDRGLYLLIEGIDLPQSYEVDFSNELRDGTSITMIGDENGVHIPEQFIQPGRNVYAFYYHVGADFGRTLYTIRIPNRARPERTDEQPTPAQESTIDQAIAALNTAVERTAQDVISADQSAQEAGQSAEQAHEASIDAQNFTEQAEQSASAAATSATQASASAQSASQSASQSAQIKTDVEGVVSDARGYADSARQSATQASASEQGCARAVLDAASAAAIARTRADEASGYAQTASTKASEAATSANTASEKASEATTSAANAANSATAAQTAKTEADTAKTQAETAQAAAETAQGKAEDAQEAAEAAAENIEASAAQIATNTADISDLKRDLSQMQPLTDDIKTALLNCFEHVAWIDEHGQDYYETLQDALNSNNWITSISAVFTQGSVIIYTSTPLNELKNYLIVTGYYNDGTTKTETNYSLSGTLEVGLSTITVAKDGKTATFNVMVSENFAPFGNFIIGNITNTYENTIVGNYAIKNRLMANNYIAFQQGDVIGFNDASLYDIYAFAFAPRTGNSVNWNVSGGTNGYAPAQDFTITVTSDYYYGLIKRNDNADMTDNDIDIINNSFGLKS